MGWNSKCSIKSNSHSYIESHVTRGQWVCSRVETALYKLTAITTTNTIINSWTNQGPAHWGLIHTSFLARDHEEISWSRMTCCEGFADLLQRFSLWAKHGRHSLRFPCQTLFGTFFLTGCDQGYCAGFGETKLTDFPRIFKSLFLFNRPNISGCKTPSYFLFVDLLKYIKK